MNTNKQTGEETMNESYKDKFNAQMKKAGIDSLGDLKSDEEKKKFFKAVDAAHKAKNESITEELIAIAEESINEFKKISVKLPGAKTQYEGLAEKLPFKVSMEMMKKMEMAAHLNHVKVS